MDPEIHYVVTNYHNNLAILKTIGWSGLIYLISKYGMQITLYSFFGPLYLAQLTKKRKQRDIYTTIALILPYLSGGAISYLVYLATKKTLKNFKQALSGFPQNNSNDANSTKS